jgi:hypothetical protein
MLWRIVAVVLTLTAPMPALDLKDAVIVAPPGKAAELLRVEVERRTGLRLERRDSRPAGSAAIELRRGSGGAPEGYRIGVQSGAVTVTGNDERGVLFGAGGLLRRLNMAKGRLSVADGLALETAPKIPLRGHQLGYRPKVNSYDAWTPAVFEQYIRDLVVFGTNAVELIPPRSDDDADSPHFPIPQMDMMTEMSRMLDAHRMEVWIWYPALDKDYADPATVEFALKEWGEVFRKLPRIDAVFVPGGDPGHTRPRYLMALLEKQTAQLKKLHPNATMWVSPQSFTAEWMEEFFAILAKEPAWLKGLVFGPQTRITLPELRQRTPKRYPIRRYPDITHSRHCQYMVPDWDLAFAITQGREVINPRPTDMARIFRLLQPHSDGFITYSEGVNDDVNKFVWSALGWDPDADVTAILRDYSRYFLGEPYADAFAQGLLALERNWRGPLAANTGVDVTLRQFQAIERGAPPELRANWRFQQGLYRAYYDGYNRARLIYETALEEEAMARLREAPRSGALAAMDAAEEALRRAVVEPLAQDLRGRVFELAEALWQSIRMQLSVPRYQAIAPERGANLDMIDMPLNNRVYLMKRFAELRQLPEAERLKGIAEIVDWRNPGPGGFYDNLGDPMAQPRLVRGPGFWEDPAHTRSSIVGFAVRGLGQSAAGNMLEYPITWWRHAEAIFDQPLEMRYEGLDPAAQYRIRVVYAGEQLAPRIRLVANGTVEIHPLAARPVPFAPLDFEIPPAATAGGTLNLTWSREPGAGGGGRGLQVAEVWLMKR